MNGISLSEDELRIVGEYPFPYPGFPPIFVFNTPIAPAENYEALFKGERPLWLPGMADISIEKP